MKTEETMKVFDLCWSNHGTIWLLTPQTAEGDAWVNEHIPEDAQQIGGAIAVEPRYVPDIDAGLKEDGLTSNITIRPR